MFLVLDLLQNASIYALILIGHSIAMRHGLVRGRNTWLGTLFGASGILSMSLAIDITPEIHGSTRAIPIYVAAYYGGPVPAAITVTPTLLKLKNR